VFSNDRLCDMRHSTLRPVTDLPFVGHHFWPNNQRPGSRTAFGGVMSAHAYEADNRQRVRVYSGST
jgi:hypothetical protein